MRAQRAGQAANWSVIRTASPAALPAVILASLVAGAGCPGLVQSVAAAGAAPDIDAPLKTGHSAAGDVAVVIGNEDYGKIADVPWAYRDAAAFTSFLKYTRGVPSERVRVLKDSDADQMRAAVAEMAAKKPTGLFWIYYAGHGMADPNGKDRLLLGWDAAGSADSLAKKGASVEGLQAAAAASGAQVVMLIDACYNGGTRSDRPGQSSLLGGARIAVPEDLLTPPRVLEWSASAPSQLALPLDSVQHGAFTYLAIGALRGWADGERDGRRDGIVTLEEAQLYVENRFSAMQLTSQQPRVSGEGWDRPISGRSGASLERGPADEVLQQIAGTAPPPPPPPTIAPTPVAPTPVATPRPTPATPVATPRPTPATPATPIATARVDLSAEMEARRKREEAAAAAAEAERLKREAAAAQERLIAEKTAAHQTAARTDWAQVVGFASGGGPEAIAAIEKFIQLYSAPLTIEGQARVVPVPEVDQARALLARLKSAKPPATTQAAVQTVPATPAPTPAPQATKGGQVLAMYNYRMVDVAPGTFLMGSPINEAGRDNDETPHKVTLTRAFSLGATEVTQALWQGVMGENPVRLRAEQYESGDSFACEKMGVQGDLPVFCVAWIDAVKFVNKLSQLEGLTPAYTLNGNDIHWDNKANGYRLPTEAEWEYAARAATIGARFSGTNVETDLCRYGNVANTASRSIYPWITWATPACSDAYTGVAPVAKFQANPWGLYDMTGNVREWVWDSHANYTEQAATDPMGAQNGANIARGGSWADPAAWLRVAFRGTTKSTYDTLIGVRIARNR